MFTVTLRLPHFGYVAFVRVCLRTFTRLLICDFTFPLVARARITRLDGWLPRAAHTPHGLRYVCARYGLLLRLHPSYSCCAGCALDYPRFARALHTHSYAHTFGLRAATFVARRVTRRLLVTLPRLHAELPRWFATRLVTVGCSWTTLRLSYSFYAFTFVRTLILVITRSYRLFGAFTPFDFTRIWLRSPVGFYVFPHVVCSLRFIARCSRYVAFERLLFVTFTHVGYAPHVTFG